MKSLFIASALGYTGKSLVAICLGKILMERGVKVGYFKPYGTLPVMKKDRVVDEDADCIAEQLKLDDDMADICPVILTHELQYGIFKGKSANPREKILAAFERVSKGKDVVFAGGGRTIYEGISMGYSTLDFIEETNSNFLLIDKYEENRGLDFSIYWKERLGNKFLGIIINMVDPENMDYLRKLIVPFLEKRGVPVIGMMPHDAVLSAITVGDLAEALGAQLYTGRDRRDNLVHQFMIGAMNMEAALSRFRKVQNKCVVTGGDRMDLQLAALETNTKCLVLTGGITPHPLIHSKADELHIPIIVVPYDTASAISRIDAVSGRPRMREPRKIERAIKLFEDGVNIEKLGLF